jgi:hypothetical protein
VTTNGSVTVPAGGGGQVAGNPAAGVLAPHACLALSGGAHARENRWPAQEPRPNFRRDVEVRRLRPPCAPLAPLSLAPLSLAPLSLLRGVSGFTRPTAAPTRTSPLRRRRGRCWTSPPPRTKWTRRVLHPVLIGHAASLSQEAWALLDLTGEQLARGVASMLGAPLLRPSCASLAPPLRLPLSSFRAVPPTRRARRRPPHGRARAAPRGRQRGLPAAAARRACQALPPVKSRKSPWKVTQLKSTAPPGTKPHGGPVRLPAAPRAAARWARALCAGAAAHGAARREQPGGHQGRAAAERGLRD